MSDNFASAQEMVKALNQVVEDIKDDMPSSQVALIERLIKETKKLILSEDGKTFDKALEISNLIMQGDYLGAMSKLGKDGAKFVAEAYAKKAGYTDPEVGIYIDYGINLYEDTVSAVTEFAIDPSYEKAGKIAWNLSVQPVLDTSGEMIEDIIKLIPGISEYYYDEHGAEDIGDVGRIALSGFYEIVTGDKELAQTALECYEDGLWEGIWNCGEEVVDFVKDSGGFFEALKRVF